MFYVPAVARIGPLRVRPPASIKRPTSAKASASGIRSPLPSFTFANLLPRYLCHTPLPLHLTPRGRAFGGCPRSEEHTSELLSLMRISYEVFCLKINQHIYSSALSFTYKINIETLT